MNENVNKIDKLASLEKELKVYTAALNNAADAIDSTEREIVSVLEDLVDTNEETSFE